MLFNYYVPTGCGFQFSSETEVDGPLEVLKEGDKKTVVLPSKNCTINASSSMYLECGTWRPINEMSVLNTFSLNQSCMDSPILKASHLILPRVRIKEEFTQIHHGCLQIWSYTIWRPKPCESKSRHCFLAHNYVLLIEMRPFIWHLLIVCHMTGEYWLRETNIIKNFKHSFFFETKYNISILTFTRRLSLALLIGTFISPVEFYFSC